MKMKLVLELQDIPGQLVSVLSPISDLGGNMISIVHDRGVKTEKGLIPIQISIEGERENLNAILNKFNEMGINILEKDDVVLRERVSTVLIGDVIDTDVRDTIDRINGLEGVWVVGLDIKLNKEYDSSAMITIESPIGKTDIAFDKIQEIAKEKDLLVINEV